MQTRKSGLSTAQSNDPYLINKPSDRSDESLNFKPIFGVIQRRVGIIFVATTLATTATFFWTKKQTPVYEGKAQILVEPLVVADNQLLVLLAKSLKENADNINKSSTSLDYQALMQVLRSPKLMEPVIKNIKTKYPEVSYGSLVGYQAPAKAPVGMLDIARIAKGKDESRVIEIRYQDTNPEKIRFVLSQVSQAYLNYSQQQQQQKVSAGIKFVNQQIPRVQTQVEKLQAQLQRFQESYNVVDPELQSQQLLTRLNQIEEQRLDNEQKLVSARSLNASLQKQLGVQDNVAISASVLSEHPNYQDLLTRMQEVDAKIAKESSRFSDQNPFVQSLREERARLNSLLSQQARTALGTTSLNTNAVQLTAYQNTVRRDLIKQLADSSNQIKFLEASNRTIAQAKSQLNQELNQLPSISRQYTSLQREAKVANETLSQLLTRREVLRVDAAQQESPWEIIMPPQVSTDKKGNPVKVSPNLPRNLALGGLGGILLGTAAAFLIDNRREALRNVSDLRSATKLPLFGVIPHNKELRKLTALADVLSLTQRENQTLVVSRNGRLTQYSSSPFLESFRSLAAKIEHLKANEPLRTLAITSATIGDGKSTVATYLAQMIAEGGQRVLLVDTDLRNPQIHSRLGLSNLQGLSEVLCRGLDVSEAIQQSLSQDNLSVLTSGQTPPNPAKLLLSKKMQLVMEQLSTRFDLVIYNTPSILGFSDSHILSSNIDEVLVVVGLGKTSTHDFKHALDELRTYRASVLGIVANTVER